LPDRRSRRGIAVDSRLEIHRFIVSLQCADSQQTDLYWCQVAEGRRTLEAIDPGLGAVLDNPTEKAGPAEVTAAEHKLRVLIRMARKAGLPLLASAWLPWLHTLRMSKGDEPGFRTLGKRMWALIEPARIQAEEGGTCLTPEDYRPDQATVSGWHWTHREFSVNRRRSRRTPLPLPA